MESFSVFDNCDNSCPNSWLQPSPSPFTATIDNYFFWNHLENTFSSQENIFNSTTVENQTQFVDDHSNNVVFSGFHSRLGVGSEYLLGFPDQRQERGFVDGLIHLDHVNDHDDLDWSPMSGSKEKKSGSSSTSWIKGQWTLEEDRNLIELVKRYGYRKWAMVAQHMVGRIGKQCRERWQNHLRPDIKKDYHWSEEEERLLIDAHQRVGNKWAEIAKYIPGRTENSIKNHWNATKRKQTSKRKIKKPAAALNGIKQSVLLEEYIQKKYFNKGSSSNSGNSPESSVNDPNAPPSPSADDAPISYLTYEDYEEEMNFMTNLFGNKDNNIGASRKNSCGNNSSSSCPTSAPQIHKGSMGNDCLGSSSRPNKEQNGVTIGIPTDEGANVFLHPEFYLGSSTFDGSQ